MDRFDFLKTIGPGRASMIVGALMMLLGFTGAVMGMEIISGLEKWAIAGGFVLFIMGVWLSAMREGRDRK